MRGAPLTNPFFRPEEKHVPSGAVSEILGLIDDYDMLGRYAGKWRSHPDGDSIGFQHQHSLSAQPAIGVANAAHIGVKAFSYNFQRWPLTGLGEVPVNRQFRLCIETHGLSEVSRGCII